MDPNRTISSATKREIQMENDIAQAAG